MLLLISGPAGGGRHPRFRVSGAEWGSRGSQWWSEIRLKGIPDGHQRGFRVQAGTLSGHVVVSGIGLGQTCTHPNPRLLASAIGLLQREREREGEGERARQRERERESCLHTFIELCYVIVYDSILYYIMLCYVMLCYSIV